MICMVDGNSCLPGQLKLRTMNFSQPWRGSEIKKVGYRVWLPEATLSSWLTQNLPEYVADCQAFPGDDPERLEALLRERNWPTPEEICREDVLLLAAVEYFGHDILLHALGDGAPDAPGYVLNTVDAVERDPQGVWLIGQGRQDLPAPYQDL